MPADYGILYVKTTSVGSRVFEFDYNSTGSSRTVNPQGYYTLWDTNGASYIYLQFVIQGRQENPFFTVKVNRKDSGESDPSGLINYFGKVWLFDRNI